MQRCALCRHELRYIDMAERSADMLTLLRAIRDVSGDEYSELYERPLSNDAFKLFNQTINTVLQVPIPEDSSLDVDQGQQLGPGHRREETLRTIFEAFRTCLFAVAEQSPPLVLVIDHLNLEKQDFMLVEKELLRYCVKRLDIGVMLLLDDKHSDYQISQRPGLYRRFQVPKLPRDQWVELAMEYIRRVIVEKQLAVDKQKTWLERGRELVEQYIATDDWLPGDLEWVVSGLERRYR